MNARLQAIFAYIVARANESSTWQGVVLVITATGIHLRQDMITAISIVGVGLAGMVGAVFPDKLRKP